MRRRCKLCRGMRGLGRAVQPNASAGQSCGIRPSPATYLLGIPDEVGEEVTSRRVVQVESFESFRARPMVGVKHEPMHLLRRLSAFGRGQDNVDVACTVKIRINNCTCSFDPDSPLRTGFVRRNARDCCPCFICERGASLRDGVSCGGIFL